METLKIKCNNSEVTLEVKEDELDRRKIGLQQIKSETRKDSGDS